MIKNSNNHDDYSLLNLIESVYMHHHVSDDDACDTGNTGNAIVEIKDLKSRPGSTNIRNPETGRTLLYEAAANGDDVSVRQLLLADKADKAVKKKSMLGGDTPLHVASAHGHLKVIKLLLGHDCIDTEENVVNIRNKFGASPLHYAKNVATASLLLSSGATLDLSDFKNQTPLAAVEARPKSEENKAIIQYLTEMADKKVHVAIRKELEANRERRRRVEAIKAEQRQIEAAERTAALNKKVLSDYKKWRCG